MSTGFIVLSALNTMKINFVSKKTTPNAYKAGPLTLLEHHQLNITIFFGL